MSVRLYSSFSIYYFLIVWASLLMNVVILVFLLIYFFFFPLIFSWFLVYFLSTTTNPTPLIFKYNKWGGEGGWAGCSQKTQNCPFFWTYILHMISNSFATIDQNSHCFCLFQSIIPLKMIFSLVIFSVLALASASERYGYEYSFF